MQFFPVPFLQQPMGAGDAFAAVAKSAIGIEHPCEACEEKRKRWNEKLRLVPVRSKWTVPPAVPEGWTKRAERNPFVLLSNDSGAWIIWEIVDGKYRNSHSFCATCVEPEKKARAKFEELCR